MYTMYSKNMDIYSNSGNCMRELGFNHVTLISTLWSTPIGNTATGSSSLFIIIFTLCLVADAQNLTKFVPFLKT
jgi:hypothetical protein